MISWLCFEWKTGFLPESGGAFHPLVFRAAVKDDEEGVTKAIKSSFSMDSSWGDISRPLAARMAADIEKAFDSASPSCVVLVHGARVIGASVLAVGPDEENHLLSGPAIVHEYRNRGLATGLLAESLAFLAGKSVALARGVTRANSITARFVYPKFGGAQHPFAGDPLAAKGA